jgi:hypothetical protein
MQSESYRRGRITDVCHEKTKRNALRALIFQIGYKAYQLISNAFNEKFIYEIHRRTRTN